MIIGRKEEIAKLKRAYDSEYSEFVAVYGEGVSERHSLLERHSKRGLRSSTAEYSRQVTKNNWRHSIKVSLNKA